MFTMIYNKINNLKANFTARLKKKQCVLGRDSCFFGESRIFNLSKNPESIIIGASTMLRGELLVYPFNGKIVIGDYCYIGEGSRVWSASSILIGNNVLISHNVDIHDSNDHPIDAKERHQHYRDILTVGHLEKYAIKPKSILIQDDVWIGFGAAIMKGVKIGKGAIVAAHAVVVNDVPPYVVVAGNPASIIKRLKAEDLEVDNF